MADETVTLKEWSILELMGHIRTAGIVTEESHFGTAIGRIDIPQKDGSFVTQFFGGSAVYRLVPTTEEIARAVAVENQASPVHRFELPAPRPQMQAHIIGGEEPPDGREHEWEEEQEEEDEPSF